MIGTLYETSFNGRRGSCVRADAIGVSPAWEAVVAAALRVAATEATVFLQGESGTGKEVIARLIHRASPRRHGPFVAINCAALPEQLLESELFGYERGAFTGAQQSKAGLIELAARGVLFLDAVSEMTGVNPEFLENEEFAASILPTLRGLKAISKYDCPPDEKLSCPISAFLGDDDEVATYEKVLPWSERTTSEFSVKVFPGHHFYLTDHIAELVGEIEPKILSSCRG